MSGGKLTFKEFEYDDKSNTPILIENLEIELSVKDWNHVKYLINNFNFWTTKEYKEKIVTDGHGYIIEGYRPEAKNCGKLERKLVFRGGAPDIDEINWMCSDLISIYIHKN